MTTLTPAEASALFRRPPERHIEVAQGAVAYRRVGQGPDVLFVHGWPFSSATFRTLLPHLVPHVTCHLLDLPGAGDSRFNADHALGFANHVRAVREAVDALGLTDFAVVGHDSGGMIARHALAGDPRVRAWGLINTEQPQGLSWRFKLFLLPRRLPGFGAALAWAVGRPLLRRNPLLLGDAFADPSLLDGEFDDFFLKPIQEDPAYRAATLKIMRSFETEYVEALGALHQKIQEPVQLVWGEQDPFFPLAWTREMVQTFPDARLHVVKDAKLVPHEERPEEVAAALLPVLRGSGEPAQA